MEDITRRMEEEFTRAYLEMRRGGEEKLRELAHNDLTEGLICPYKHKCEKAQPACEDKFYDCDNFKKFMGVK